MFRRTFSAFTLIATLAGSALMSGTALAGDHKPKHKQKQKHEARYYDRGNRDYHAWNGDEDRRYREYLTQHHRRYTIFSRMNQKQQHAYWQWRHDHR